MLYTIAYLLLDSRGFLESKQFADTLGVLYHSNHPLATLVAGNVAKTLMSTRKVLFM